MDFDIGELALERDQLLLPTITSARPGNQCTVGRVNPAT